MRLPNACPYCLRQFGPTRATVQPCPHCKRPVLPALNPQTRLPDALLPADLGRYCLTALCGHGGMGRVCRGQDKVTGQAVAVKFSLESPAWDSETRNRFAREISLLKSLLHPNVVRHLADGTEADTRYYVMEWVAGDDLARVLAGCRARGGCLPFDYVHRCFRQLCAALQALHDRGIVHRDVKPSNIIVTAEGTVKLIDLGIARPQRAAAGSTATTSLGTVGTLEYAAPEQRLGHRAVDHRVDIYSAGLVIYEMLTGFLPKGTVRKPSAVNPTVPGWFDEVLMRMMEHEPAARPSAVGPLADEAAGVGRGDNAARSGPVPTHADPAARRKADPAPGAEIGPPSMSPWQEPRAGGRPGLPPRTGEGGAPSEGPPGAARIDRPLLRKAGLPAWGCACTILVALAVAALVAVRSIPYSPEGGKALEAPVKTPGSQQQVPFPQRPPRGEPTRPDSDVIGRAQGQPHPRPTQSEPTWLRGMEVRVRKADEADFTKDTKERVIEVSRDENTGDLIYVSETGSVSVVPGR